MKEYVPAIFMNQHNLTQTVQMKEYVPAIFMNQNTNSTTPKTVVPTSTIQIKSNSTSNVTLQVAKNITSNSTQTQKVNATKVEQKNKNETIVHTAAPSNKTLVEVREYPGENYQNLAQGYEGMFRQDKRMFPEFEDQGDYVQLASKEYPAGNA